MKAIGHEKWVIPGGHIPLKSTGKEPAFLSQDRLSILNTAANAVTVKITVFYTKQDAVTGYTVGIKGQRLKKIRINDLIDPLPVDLAKDYSLVIEADGPIVVQFMRMNTGHESVSTMGTMGFASI
jgi:hypothetical protein